MTITTLSRVSQAMVADRFAVGDFNADLCPDLAVALINVSILIGTGQGRFWFNNLIRRIP
jgi:hypothetical protein